MNAERSAARNYGVVNADKRARFILLLDSDMELSPNVVEECVAAYISDSAGVAMISEEPITEGFLIECKNIKKAAFGK